jgi:ABC-type uncharacterized transport system substrate-binding protein
MSDEVVGLSAKRMEILKEAAPHATRIAIVWNRDDQGMTLRYQEIEKAARILNVNVQPHGVRAPDDFPTVFAEMTRRRPDAMFVVLDALTNVNRKQFVEFAATHRIPAMYEAGFIVREGGLMSYGPRAEDELRRTAVYIDRILRGAKPADLPAEQPTRYYLSVTPTPSQVDRQEVIIPPAGSFAARGPGPAGSGRARLPPYEAREACPTVRVAPVHRRTPGVCQDRADARSCASPRAA